MIYKTVAWAKTHKILAAVVAAFIFLVAWRLMAGLGGGEIQGDGKPGAGGIYVTLGKAEKGPLREVGAYYGSLKAASQFYVAPRLGGQLKTLLVDIGDEVKSGQVVAQLDDEEYLLTKDHAAHSVSLAEAQVEEARANLELAENDLARQTNLSKKSIITQADFEASETKVKQARARLMVSESMLSQARNNLAETQLRLSYTQVEATWPGGGTRYVGERLADASDLVAANKPLISLVSLDPLLVVVDVIERDYPKIKIGQEAVLSTEAWPGQTFSAKVVRVAPVLSVATRQARVELEVANPDLKLKPGMFAALKFIFSQVQDVWSVPEDVPFRTNEGFVIFVAAPETKTVKKMPVELGLVENGRVELRGVEDLNAPIVFLGQHLLDDGQAYNLPGETPGPASDKTAPPSGKKDGQGKGK